MARINRYDTPAESNYFNTFVPLPLDQITALGMKRQEDLERRQDVASKYIDQASLVDYIANSKDEEWVKQQYLPQIQKLAEEAMSTDLSNPVEWAKYSTRLRTTGTSDKIRRIEESKARWNQAQEMKQKLIAAGKYNQLLDEDPAIGWDSETGIYNYMPEAYTDKSDLFEQYYKHMKPQSKGIVTLEGGLKALRQGIDMNDVRNISNRAAQELAANPLGQQQVKLFRKMYGDISKDMSDVDILKMQMEDYGRQYISSDDQLLPEFAQGAGGGDPTNLISSWRPIATGGTGKKIVQDPSNILQNGTANLLGELDRDKVSGSYGYGSMSSDLAPIADYTTRIKNLKEAYKIVEREFPELTVDKDGNKLSETETVKRYKEASENQMGGAMYVSNDPSMIEYLNNLLDNTYQAYKYISPGTDEPLTAQETMKKLGFSNMQEFRNALQPAGPSLDVPEGMSLIVSPKKGNRYSSGIKNAGNQIIAVGDIGLGNELSNLKNIKNMVETAQRGVVMLGEAEDGLYGVEIDYKLGTRNGKEAFVPVYKVIRSTPDGKNYDYVYTKDANNKNIPSTTNMNDIYGLIVDNIFKGQGYSPYDMNLSQSVSSTGRRKVISSR
jgi:hypothetical protein